MRRRDLLLGSAAAAAAIATGSPLRAASCEGRHRTPRPLRILVLGGTGFVGPAIVDLAIELGHQVTLFNRGLTNPWLYGHLERLEGDRHRDRGAGLTALEGSRRWDAVIDTWQGSPLAVEATARLLGDRVGSYVYVSSVAVSRASFAQPGFDESAPLPPVEMPSSWEDELPYPLRKQLGEETVAAALPGRSAFPRAYGIVGTDPRGSLEGSGIPYWPVRLLRGGEILAPGDGADLTQWTDVRDLAEFVLIRLVEEGRRGAFNVAREATFADYLEGLASLVPASAPELVWVPAELLFESGLESFSDVPQWVWRREPECCFFHARTERARAAGFRPRSIHQTFGPILDAYRLHHQASHQLDGELPRREADVIAAWRRRAPGAR